MLPLLNFFTPVIVIVSVPAPLILAPMLFKKSAIFTISGSLAALNILVWPLALTAANIMFIVAPTEGKSKVISAPFSSRASIIYLSPSIFTVAPKASKPFIW